MDFMDCGFKGPESKEGEDLTFRDDLREEQRRLKRIFIKLSCVVCVIKLFFN